MKKTGAVSKQKSTVTFQNLYTWNAVLAVVHSLQGAIILLLSTTKVFPVQTSYLTLDPLASEFAGNPVLASATRHLFDVNLTVLVAAFFFMSAVAHALAATVYRRRYEADLTNKINRVRWFEYALSASTMMVAIAVLSGVVELSLLLTIFALDVVMSLLGLAMESYNQGKAKPNRLVSIIGSIAGMVPWLVFVIYIWGANVYGNGYLPAFVYGIYVSMFVLFSAFAVNMFLQYRRVGNWKDYLYGERMYMLLSLIAKTVLAWQVFAGTLRP